MTRIYFLLLSLMLVLGARAALAQHYDLAELGSMVHDFAVRQVEQGAHDSVEVTVGRLDSRLRLAQCSLPLDLSIPKMQGRSFNLVAVACTSQDQSWRIFVPVTVQIKSPVVIAAQAIFKGKKITAQDLTIEMRYKRNSYHGGATEPAEFIGTLARTSIPKGRVLSPNLVELDYLVHKGQMVMIHAQNKNLRVSAKGTAQADGAAGDFIQVKNLASQKIVEAKVIATGAVVVPL